MRLCILFLFLFSDSSVEDSLDSIDSPIIFALFPFNYDANKITLYLTERGLGSAYL